MESIVIPLILSVILALTPRVKYAAQTLTTITHELGHAVAVLPFGGRLEGIKLRLTTEGEAHVSLPRYPFPLYHLLRILNLFAGYSAPIYLSFFLLTCAEAKWETAAKVVLGLMSLTVLLFIRNGFGVLVAIAFAALNGVMIFTFPQFDQYYILTVTFILLVRGVIDIVDAGRWTFGNTLDESDFTLAADELFGPPQLWYVLFCLFHTPAMLFLGLSVWGGLQSSLH